MGRVVGRDAQVEVSQLYLAHLEHRDPLLGREGDKKEEMESVLNPI